MHARDIVRRSRRSFSDENSAGRRRCACILLLVAISAPAMPAAERQTEWYVLQAKPSALVVLNPATGKTLANIPLAPNIQKAVYSSQKRAMYLLQGRDWAIKGKPAQLTVVDLENRRVRRTVTLGTFGAAASKLVLSQDQSRVFCFSPGLGNRGTKVSNVEAQSGTVFAIDTSADTLAATYRMDGGRAAEDFAVTETGDQVFMVSGGMRQAGTGGAVAAGLTFGLLLKMAMPKKIDQELAIFGGNQSAPRAAIPLNMHLASVARSSDRKRLFLLGQTVMGEGKNAGSLQVVDLDTGKPSVPQAVGKDPLRLVKLGDRPGLWLAGQEELRFLADDGTLAEQRILLKKPHQSMPEDVAGAILDGYPGESILVGEDRAAFLVTKSNGAPVHKLALVDLNQRRVEAIVPTGRKSVRAGKLVAKIALTAAVAAASYGAVSAGSPYFVYIIPGMGGGRNEALAGRNDGQRLYALNPASSDITVIQSSNGIVEGHIPVDANAFRLWIPRDSKFLFCLSPNKVELIDTMTNQKVQSFKLSGGAIRDVHIDADASRLRILTAKSAQEWDAAGKLVYQVDGLAKATQLISQ